MEASDLLQFWSFVFLAVLVYTAGEQIKRVFPKLVKTKLYQRTVVMHAPLVSTSIAALPIFPMPDMLGDGIGARMLFGVVCGITCAWTYKAFMRILGKDTKSQS